MIKRRLFRSIIAITIMSSMVVTPVSATSLEEKKAAAESQVSSLQTQLTKLMTKINTLETKLTKKGEQIIEAEGDLDVAKKKEQEQYKAMKLRIKYMYEDGNKTAVEKIVSSGSFTEMLEQVEYASSIHTYDRNALNDYKKTKNKIEKLKKSLETEVKDLKKMEKEYSSQQTELNVTLTSKEAEVADLDDQIQEAARAALEAQRKAEEEAAKKAAKKAQEEAAEKDSGDDTQQQNTTQQNTNTAQQDTNTAQQSTNTTPQDTTQEETTNDTTEAESSSANDSAPSYDAGSGSSIVARARSKMGVPYKWGACSPNAFDCSGFVSYCLTGAYSRLGTTYTFLGWTRVKNPQPGDVCVNANHCGIYIGGGKMIHAPHTGAVVSVGSVQGGMIYVRY